MKKWFFVVAGIAILIAGIYVIEKQQDRKIQSSAIKNLHQEDFNNLIETPEKFVGFQIEGDGLVEESNYIEEKGVYTIILLDPQDYADPIYLHEPSSKVPLEEQTYVHFTGKVDDVYQNKNIFGRKNKMPKVVVSSLDSVGNPDVDEELLKKVFVNQVEEVEGIVATVEKIELYSSSTRVYVKIENKLSNRIYFNDDSMRLVADGVGISSKYEILNSNMRLARSLESLKETDGILSFKKLSLKTEEVIVNFSMSIVDKSEQAKFEFQLNLKPK